MATKPYVRTPSHIRKLRSQKKQAFDCVNAMIQAFDNEDYEHASSLAKEAQHSLAVLWSTYNMYRGWQENGVREEAWAR